MFNLTKTENKALLILGAVLIISTIIQWLQPQEMNSKLFDYSLQDSLFKIYSADTAKKQIDKKRLIIQKDPPTRNKHKKQTLKKNSININRAGKKDLERLPQIGPVTAQKILDLRQEVNGFTKAEDLLKVKGIGPKTLEKIRPFIFLIKDTTAKK